jgi:hypothetical protein
MFNKILQGHSTASNARYIDPSRARQVALAEPAYGRYYQSLTVDAQIVLSSKANKKIGKARPDGRGSDQTRGVPSVGRCLGGTSLELIQFPPAREHDPAPRFARLGPRDEDAA